MFIDEKRVYLKAGNGGDGCASFRREKFIPKGGPDGGDGGKGGDIVLFCDRNTADLTVYHYQSRWQAYAGHNGMKRQKFGKGGEDCILKVPEGTVIINPHTGRKVTELLEHGQRIVLLPGGKGGLGNVHFKSATNRAPRRFTEGEKREEQEFLFVLKVIADIGLVGFPNAGKSTLTNLITNAKPKMAPYPFTTKIPNVGVIDYPSEYKRLRMADIPGLIEGASENKGLGHRFLRHIERCRLLLYLIDMGGVDQRNPVDDYAQLRTELSRYSEKLPEKPKLVVANKMDVEGAQENLKEFRKAYPDLEILELSCAAHQGVTQLKQKLLQLSGI